MSDLQYLAQRQEIEYRRLAAQRQSGLYGLGQWNMGGLGSLCASNLNSEPVCEMKSDLKEWLKDWDK